MSALIMVLGLTFFPNQPYWYELDTRGIEWTVSDLTDPNVLGVPSNLTYHPQEETK